jgi:hypothetical protein
MGFYYIEEYRKDTASGDVDRIPPSRVEDWRDAPQTACTTESPAMVSLLAKLWSWYQEKLIGSS